MRTLLRQLNFGYKRPEKIPFRVDEKAQRNFIEQYNALKKQLSSQDGLYFMDATHPEHTAIPGHGWIKRGVTKVLKSNPRPYRLNIQGAINIGTLNMVVRFEEKINKETTLNFLEALRKQQPEGWIYLICDNAGYYSASEVKLYAESMAIKLIYLPPYCPNLNRVERIWKFFKKKILYNQYYETFPDMVEASKNFFQKIGQHYYDLQRLSVHLLLPRAMECYARCYFFV
jgi:transposase